MADTKEQIQGAEKTQDKYPLDIFKLQNTEDKAKILIEARGKNTLLIEEQG